MFWKRVVREIHRRSIWQVLLLYVGGSWGVLQFVDQLQSHFTLPDWTYGLAFVLLLVGLPIVVATAFVQEGPPGQGNWSSTAAPTGFAPEEGDIRHRPAQHRLLTWRNAIGGGVTAFMLGGIAIAAWLHFVPNASGAQSGPDVLHSIAVLPLENLSPDAADAFFADGVHDEILNQLFRIASLDVRSRTSVLVYRDKGKKTVPQIARELNVRYVLEGSVRRSGDAIRIMAQLIDAQTDRHVWSQSFDGTRADVFGFQTSVAENIARQLEAKLSPAEKNRLALKPTKNSDAYDDYLRARATTRNNERADLEAAIPLLQHAVALDSTFAPAWAALSDALSSMYWYHYDRSDSSRSQSRTAAQRALDIDPGLAEAHRAMGLYHYRYFLDYDAALAELRNAEKNAPNDANIAYDIGAVLRRKGDLAGSIESFVRSQTLDPLNGTVSTNLAESFMLMRRYDDAVRALEHAAGIKGDKTNAVMRNAMIHIELLTDYPAARRLLATAQTRRKTQFSVNYYAALTEYLERKPDAELAVLMQARDTSFQTQFYFVPRTLLIAQAYALKGDAVHARVNYDSALVLIDAAFRTAPGDPRIYAARGLTLAGLGRKAEAIDAAIRATEIMPVEKEAWRGSIFLCDLARTYAAVGEADKSIAILERLLKIPAELSVNGLRHNPAWDPLRTNPRFQRLLAGT